MDYILRHLDAMKDTQENESQHVSEDDFFSSIKTVPSTRASELDGYLACASRDGTASLISFGEKAKP